MLVCNVSLRAPRRTIAVGLAETATANDAATAGNIVFGALVDDPAAVGDTVDAYLGEIMVEAANALDTTAWVVPGVLATLDGVPTNVTLSNGNLTATHSATPADSGARSTANKSSGKYYFEATFTATTGGSDCVGILLDTGTYANMITLGTSCCTVYRTMNAIIFSNNVNSGYNLGSNIAPGDIVSVAIDLTGRKGWFRKNGGLWNGSGTADPATGVNGATIASGNFAPTVGFGGTPVGTVGDNITANFGQSAFAYSAPSGFGNWTA